MSFEAIVTFSASASGFQWIHGHATANWLVLWKGCLCLLSTLLVQLVQTILPQNKNSQGSFPGAWNECLIFWTSRPRTQTILRADRVTALVSVLQMVDKTDITDMAALGIKEEEGKCGSLKVFDGSTSFARNKFWHTALRMLCTSSNSSKLHACREQHLWCC